MTTGEAGTHAQARGLALALTPEAEERLIRIDRLWAMAPPAFIGLSPPAVTALVGRLEPPWPDVLVTCGRRSALVGMAIRRRARAPMILVHVQPPAHPKAFDLVVAMPHDGLKGPNVLCVDTALHSINTMALAVAAERGDPRFAGLPRPWTGVLLGGSTRRRAFTRGDAERLADQLDDLRSVVGGSLLVTPSRRTPAAVAAALRARYMVDRTVRIWDGDPPNPYLAILALADRLVVTSDSISMISEALATTVPVVIFGVPVGRRHAHFVQNLLDKGLVAPLAAVTGVSARTRVDATPEVAEMVRHLTWSR